MAEDNGDNGELSFDPREFRAALDELRQGQADLRDAVSSREREDAHEQIREAKADLDTLAREMGIPRTSLDKAIAEAKRSERREELRPIIDELLEERQTAEAEARKAAAAKEKKGGKGSEAKAGGRGGALPSHTEGAGTASDDEQAGDEAPVHEHWSERRMSDVVRGMVR